MVKKILLGMQLVFPSKTTEGNVGRHCQIGRVIPQFCMARLALPYETNNT